MVKIILDLHTNGNVRPVPIEFTETDEDRLLCEAAKKIVKALKNEGAISNIRMKLGEGLDWQEIF